MIQHIILIVLVVALLIYLLIKGIKNKWLSQLIQTINTAIKEAEQSDYKGQLKKKYVLEKVQEKCTELKIPYKLVISLVSKLIDIIIEHYNVISK